MVREVVAGDDLAEGVLVVAVDAQAERAELEGGEVAQRRVPVPQLGIACDSEVFEKRLE